MMTQSEFKLGQQKVAELKRIANALDKANMIAAIRLRKEWGVDINQIPGQGPHPG